MSRRAAATPCPWCNAAPGKRHAVACPCSTKSRREIRDAYRVSDYEGQRVADELRAAYVHALREREGSWGEPYEQAMTHSRPVGSSDA